MPKIEIYTTPMCPYCWRAKRLLGGKGVEYKEVDLWREPGRRPEMIARSEGRTTVPQIFIDGRPVGGSDELYALEEKGLLDPMLRDGHQGTAG